MVDKLQIKTLDTINSMRHQGQISAEDEAVLDVAERVCRDAENAKQLLPKLQAVGMQWEEPGNPIEQVSSCLARKGSLLPLSTRPDKSVMRSSIVSLGGYLCWLVPTTEP